MEISGNVVLVMILVGIIVFLKFFMLFIVKFSNPYKLFMVFGKKGSGKTTLLTKLALQALESGHPVYTTIEVPGCRKFRAEDVGSYTFPPESYIFIDEVGILWDNRNFKNFKPEVRNYFKYQRQYRNTVYLFSQSFDVDKKLRDLTDGMYLCSCIFGIFSIARRIERHIILTDATDESGSSIADMLRFVPVFSLFFGGKPFLFTYIPKYTAYFKSYDPPKLDAMPFENFLLAENFRAEKKIRICAICTNISIYFHKFLYKVTKSLKISKKR